MFSIGVAPKLTSEQQRAKARARVRAKWRKARRHEANRLEPGEIRPTAAFPVKRWFLLPMESVSPLLYWPVLRTGPTLSSAYDSFHDFCIVKPNPWSSKAAVAFQKQLRPFLKEPLKPFFPVKPFPELISEFVNILRKNASVRRLMQRLVRAWKLRRATPVNDVDIVTMDTPKKKVELCDWWLCRTYPFEADSLYKSFLRCLLMRDSMWPTPQEIRNPYTNVPLTVAQSHFAIQALRHHGYTHWVLEALRAARYDWTEFKRMQSRQLRLAALRAQFQAPETDDYHETMMDFIESEYENHEVLFPKLIYSWALKHAAEHPTIAKWRTLCFRYYYIDITHECTFARDELMQKEVYHETAGLCGPVYDLYALKKVAHRESLIQTATTN